VRLDDNVKQPFEQICDDLGLSMSSAVNVFAKAVVRKRGIPFEMTIDDSFYNEDSRNILLESAAKLERGEGTQDLYRLLDEGIAAMQSGKGKPAVEVFSEIERDFGFERV
jgi:DNA-damage-inducible protein J